MKQKMNPKLTLYILSLALASSAPAQPTDGSIPNLPHIMEDSNKDAIQLYEANLADIIKNPSKLDSMSLLDLELLLHSISISEIKSKASEKEWNDLREKETKLIGLITLSIKGRVDNSVDVTKTEEYFISYPPYDAVYPNEKDRQDVAKRKAYNDSIDGKIKKGQQLQEQIIIRRKLPRFIATAKLLLGKLYPVKQTQVSDEVALLQGVGLDKDTISLLMKSEDN